MGTRARPLLGLHSVQEKLELTKEGSLWPWMLTSWQRCVMQICPKPQGFQRLPDTIWGPCSLSGLQAGTLTTATVAPSGLSVPSASLPHLLPSHPSYAKAK